MAIAQPYDTEINGICYKIDGDEAIVTVYSDNQEWNAEHFQGDLVIPETITYRQKQYPVTTIGPKTFAYCYGITSVKLPDGLTTISDESFAHISSEYTLQMGPKVNYVGRDAFYSSLLTRLDIDPANQWFVVDDHVFYSADHKRAISLVASFELNDSINLKLHDNVEIIESGFTHGVRLNTLQMGNAVKSIGEYSFPYALSETNDQTDLILPDGIEHIGRYAFDGCIRINNLHLPDSLTRLEEGSFSYVSPEYIHMSKNLKVICDNALACSSGSAYLNLVLPEGLDSIGKYGITSICCDSLIIPSTVRYLSYNSLDNFARYIEIKAPLDSITVAGIPSSSVRELVLPKTLKRLERAAFYPCYYLQRIVWPDSLEYIAPYALAGNKLEPMVVPATVKTIGAGAFADNVWEPRTFYFTSPTPPAIEENDDLFEGIMYEQSTLYVPRGSKSAYDGKAPWSWFGTLEEYDEIVLPPAVTRYDFEHDGLYYKVLSDEEQTCEVSYDLNFITDRVTYQYKSVTVPSSVTYDGKTYTVTAIEGHAFYDTQLEHIDLPQSITNLDAAFANCRQLGAIELPDHVVSLAGTFVFCEKLKTIHLPDQVENISSAFYGCTNLQSVNVPASVHYVDGAFDGCSALQSLVLPDDIEQIGRSTFFNCTSLKHVKLPANLTRIDEIAFGGCQNLQYIILPSKLEYIFTGAFEDCSSLNDIICLNPVPPYLIGYSHFTNYEATLHVPAGSKEAYQNADGWNYFNIVEDAEEAAAIDQVSLRPSVTRIYDALGRSAGEGGKGLQVRDGKVIFIR